MQYSLNHLPAIANAKILKLCDTINHVVGAETSKLSSRPKLVAILAVLIVVMAISYSMMNYSNLKSNVRLFLNWTTNVSSASALIMSALATFQAFEISKIRKKRVNKINDYSEPKYQLYTLTWFTMGLILWFIAELSWTYYELGLGIENPFPSPADAIWLAGYPFIIYFLFRISKVLSRQKFSYDREPLILISVATALTLAYIFTLTFGIASMISNQQNMVAWIITIIYPILDGIAFVPSLLIIMKLRNKKQIEPIKPWMLLAASILLVTVADIGFGYSEVLGKTVEQGRVGIWDAIYSAGYIVIAVSMYWRYRILSTQKIQLVKTLR